MQYADDYRIGDKFDLGTYRIEADEIIAFARRYDPQPYHLSQAAGASSFFGGLVASGWHVAAIWMGLYVRAILPDAKVEGSPGVDELRWYTPVRPGDLLVGSVEVAGIVPNPFRKDLVTIRKRGALLRHNEKKPVMTLLLQSRFVRRPATATATTEVV
jgi:acyl dehydratase